MKYPNASKEPLEIIERNECVDDYFLSSKRFKAVFNEIYSQRQTIDALTAALDLASSRLGTVSDLLGDEGCIAAQKEYRKFYEESQAALEKVRGEPNA